MSEGVLGQRLEKLMKANVDSVWVRLAEENAKREKQDRERMLQITSLLTDFAAKDLPAALELGLKKSLLLGPILFRLWLFLFKMQYQLLLLNAFR
jgi:enhancer of mRNA-decapping protein 4